MTAPGVRGTLRHHVLVDPTGRRRRRLAIAGRGAAIVLGLWLVVLMLGGLGLQPLAGVPIASHLGGQVAAPPRLPERVQAAVAKHTTVALAPGAAHVPVKTVPAPRLGPGATAPPRKKSRTIRATPRVKAAPGRGPTSPVGSTSPAGALPSGALTTPTTTAPGQTRTPPGQTRTESGPPTTTPGTTPSSNGKAHEKGVVTTP